jgi:hypothetical protein
MNRWLVRTVQNEIHGPFEQEQLVESIRAGRWEPRDEACRQNHYWFSFQESEELHSQLGIRWPDRSEGGSSPEEETDEITETETETKILKDSGSHSPLLRESPFSEPLVIAEPVEQALWSHPALVVFLVILVAAAVAFFFVP